MSSLLCSGCSHSEEDLYQDATKYWEKKLYGMAAKNYEQFSYAHPEHAKADESLYKAAFIYGFYLKSPSRAIELFLRIPAIYPNSSYLLKTHENLADLLGSHLNDCPRAIEQYQQIVEIGRQRKFDLSKAYSGMAQCYFHLEDWRGALDAYEKIVRSYPGGEYADKAAYQIGYIYYLREEYREAEKAFRYFLERYPSSEWAFDGMLNLARAKEKLQR